MSESTLEYRTDGRVGVVTVDRPPVNALRYADLEAMADVLEGLPEDEELAVVLTGAGERAFVAGHDVNEFVNASAEDHAAGTDTYVRLAEALTECPVPTVAAVDGPALGTGMVLACLCDLRVVSPAATLGLPEINVGVVAGLDAVSRVLPADVARRLVYTGEPITGERAHELGLASVCTSSPVAEAMECAEAIATKRPEAVRAAKRLVSNQRSGRPAERLRRERETAESLLQGPGGTEAALAFLEGRKPEFER